MVRVRHWVCVIVVVVTLIFGAVFLMSALELRSLWPAALLHGLFDIGVNGSLLATDPDVADWQLTLMGVASLALVIAGLVAAVMFAFWREWPITDKADRSEGPLGG